MKTNIGWNRMWMESVENYMYHWSNLECLQEMYQAKCSIWRSSKIWTPKPFRQEYLIRFQRWGYNLNEMGIFVYLPMDN